MKTLQEKGIQIKSRDDALECLAELYFTYPTAQTVNPIPKPKVYVKRIKDYQCDGTVIFADSGCTGECGIFDAREALREAGIPVMTYDGSHGDPRSFFEENVRANFDAFAESLGLEELTSNIQQWVIQKQSDFQYGCRKPRQKYKARLRN